MLVEQLLRHMDNHYVYDILRDQNDINEDTDLQIDLIQDSLAKLHAEKIEQDYANSRRKIGFRVEKIATLLSVLRTILWLSLHLKRECQALVNCGRFAE